MYHVEYFATPCYWTALGLAVDQGHERIARMLLAHGANAHARLSSDPALTVLEWALHHSSWGCVWALLDHRAALEDVRDEDIARRVTPEMQAYQQGVRSCRRAMLMLLLVLNRSGLRWDPRLKRHLFDRYLWPYRAQWKAPNYTPAEMAANVAACASGHANAECSTRST